MSIDSLAKTESDINEILNDLSPYANKTPYILMVEFLSMYHNEALWKSKVGPSMTAEKLAETISYSVLDKMMEMYMEKKK